MSVIARAPYPGILPLRALAPGVDIHQPEVLLAQLSPLGVEIVPVNTGPQIVWIIAGTSYAGKGALGRGCQCGPRSKAHECQKCSESENHLSAQDRLQHCEEKAGVWHGCFSVSPRNPEVVTRKRHDCISKAKWKKMGKHLS